MTEYANYNDLVATPEKHLAFMREINSFINDGAKAVSLFDKLNVNIKVDGKPFSQAFHLNKLESHSGNWDFDEIDDSVKVEMHQLSEVIKAADGGYDIPHFTIGYEYMVDDMKDRGVDVETSVIKSTGGPDIEKAGSPGLETSVDGLDALFREDPAKQDKHEHGLSR